jgi:hypothetical membrane protein
MSLCDRRHIEVAILGGSDKEARPTNGVPSDELEGKYEVEALDKLKWPLSCIAGILMIVLYCVFTFSSLLFFQGPYSITVNYLSDLGNSTMNPTGAILYNVGISLAGLALFPFFLGLYKWYTKQNWRRTLLILTQIVGFVEAFSLIMIGVFPETAGDVHDLWSYIQFALNLVVLIFANVALITHPRFIKVIAYYGFLVVAVQVLTLVLIFLGNSSPLVEWFTVFSTLFFVGLVVINMFKAFPSGKDH